MVFITLIYFLLLYYYYHRLSEFVKLCLQALSATDELSPSNDPTNGVRPAQASTNDSDKSSESSPDNNVGGRKIFKGATYANYRAFRKLRK